MLNYPFEASLEVQKEQPKQTTSSPAPKEESFKFQIILDKTGWPDAHVTSIPFVQHAQNGVYAKNSSFKHTIFTTILLDQVAFKTLSANILFIVTLHDDFSDAEVKEALSYLPMLTQKHNDANPENPICSLVGVNFMIWRRWDAKPATELRDFDAKVQRSSKTGKPVFPKWEGGHIFVLCKCNAIDSVIDLVRSFIEMFGKNQFNEDNVKSYTQTIGFAYNGGKDLTGFIDGTRNPDHMLRALTDQVLIHPGDCPNDKADSHVGGCYAYAGKFVHDLKKFRAMSDEDKNNLMGRDLKTVTPHKGFDTRPENPRLENAPEYAHTNRGHGSMYRQAYPFRNEHEEGLFFCAFSRFLSEIDSALNRMAGDVESGELDGVFKFSKNLYSNYYYVPSLPELQELFLKADVVVPENERAAPGKLNMERNNNMENKKKINIEYCTNCGYVTHYMAIKQAIEEVSPNVVVVPNPFLPRLSSFEITTEEGEVLWSKLSHPDGRTNYAHVFPDKKIVCERVRNYLGMPSQEQPLAPEK